MLALTDVDGAVLNDLIIEPLGEGPRGKRDTQYHLSISPCARPPLQFAYQGLAKPLALERGVYEYTRDVILHQRTRSDDFATVLDHNHVTAVTTLRDAALGVEILEELNRPWRIDIRVTDIDSVMNQAADSGRVRLSEFAKPGCL